MTQTEVVRLRPQRVRIVCYIAAVLVLAVFTVVGVALSGPFGIFDQVAMVGLGVIAALGVLLFTRPRIEADATGARVQNLIGGYEVPWGEVVRIRFDQHSPWAFLELQDDESLAVLAVQAADKEYAAAGVRALRQLHQAATKATPGG